VASLHEGRLAITRLGGERLVLWQAGLLVSWITENPVLQILQRLVPPV
jgi:hypothetical protein